jgi:DNA-binding beta-propeller fold protein YncE
MNSRARGSALIAVAIVAPSIAAALHPSAVAADPASLPAASGTVWVTERTTGFSTLSAFDAASGVVLGTVPVGNGPIGVTVPHGTGKVYTSDGTPTNQLSVIDADSISSLGTIPMGLDPHHMMASADGKRIYVAEYGWNRIGIVDTGTDSRVTGFVASGNPAAHTHAVWVTSDERLVYAANEGATQTPPTIGTLSKLDASTGSISWEIPIGVRPSEVLVTNDGKTAYVSIRGENKLVVVDVSGDSPEILGDVFIGTQPDTLTLLPNGKTLVVGLRSTTNQVAFFDTASWAVSWTSLAGHGISGHQALSANGRYTFIAMESPGTLAVIDNASGTVVADYPYPTGRSRPHGVFLEATTRP